jgi:hypothetical protein
MVIGEMKVIQYLHANTLHDITILLTVILGRVQQVVREFMNTLLQSDQYVTPR